MGDGGEAGDLSGARSSPRRQPQTPHDAGHLRCIFGFVHEPSAFFPHFFRHLCHFPGFFRTFFAHLAILRPHCFFSLHARAVWHSEYPVSQYGAGYLVGGRHR